MSLRVVHAIRSDAFAGVEQHVARLAAAQTALGHCVVVIGGHVKSMRAATESAEVTVLPAVTLFQTASAINHWRSCDLVHVHMTAAESAAVLAVGSWRVPVVSTRHFARRRGASPAGHLAVPFISRRIAAQIAVSQYVAERIGGRSTVVYPGVPSVMDCKLGAERGLSVLVAQRLEAEKDTDVAVRAFALSGLVERGWHLDIAGDGAQRAPLTLLAQQLGIARSVHFLGHRSDVSALMQEAGLLLAPCPVEALGLTVLEAMAAGLPVVVSGAGGHLETAGSVTGAAIFSPGDASGAATLLADLAEDVALRDRYANRLQATQRHRFTVEAQALATDAVYRSVL